MTDRDDPTCAGIGADAAAEFRIRTYYRNVAVVGLILLPMASVVLWADAPPDRLVLLAFLSATWGTMAGLSLWVLFALWRARLIFEGNRLVLQGVIGRRQIDLEDVVEVRWRLTRHGRITLRTAETRITISLGCFEPPQRLWLIRYLRDRLPAELQHNWDRFCHKIALPLRDLPRPRTAAGPNEVTLTRRRWDWYCVPLVLVTAGVAIYAACWLELPRMLAAPILPLGLWAALRFGTPKAGMVVERIPAPERRWLVVLAISGLSLGVAGVIIRFLRPGLNLGPLPMTLFVIWCGGILWLALRLERATRQRDAAGSATAAKRWDEARH